MSLPSAPRRLTRIFFEARSVRPPAFAMTESRVNRSSLSNCSAPEPLTSPMQKTVKVVFGTTLMTSAGKIGMFQTAVALWKSSCVLISSVSDRPLSARRSTRMRLPARSVRPPAAEIALIRVQRPGNAEGSRPQNGAEDGDRLVVELLDVDDDARAVDVLGGQQRLEVSAHLGRRHAADLDLADHGQVDRAVVGDPPIGRQLGQLEDADVQEVLRADRVVARRVLRRGGAAASARQQQERSRPIFRMASSRVGPREVQERGEPREVAILARDVGDVDLARDQAREDDLARAA